MTTPPGTEPLSAAKRALLEQRLRGAARPVADAAAAPRPRREKAPLSFAQERLWFLHQWEPESPAYNVSTAYRLRGPLDAARLRQALDVVLARHDVLRTRFPIEDDVPVQVVAPPGPTRLDVEDVSSAPDPVAEARRIANAETVSPFDLAAGPVCRFRLLRMGEGDHVLVTSFHHIAFDGWSFGVFLGELRAAYAALLQGAEPAFPPLPMQYADFAAWQRETQAATIERHVEHWTSKLTGVTPLELPTDRPRPATPRHEGARFVFRVPAPVAAAARSVAREEQATEFMALLAAFQALLHRHTGQTDLAIGTPVAGRTHPDVGGLVGFFVNNLVLRGDVEGSCTFRDLVRRARATTLEAFSHQEAPFERLVEALHPDRDASRTPIYQVMFALQDVSGQAFRLADVEVESFHVDRTALKLDLSLFMHHEGDGLFGTFAYDTALFDAETIHRMAESLVTLLAAAVENPDRAVADLPILTPALRARLVHEWNDTQRDAPLDRTVAQLFEEAAARAPHADAVIFEGERLSYAELNARANRLARRLRSLGVGPGSLVALAAPRAPVTLVGMLGVLKAGAAYVPLDPANPQERIRLVMEDAGAAALLADAATAARLPPHPRTVFLDDSTLADEAADDLPHLAGPDDVAYVIYTSGSTGKPKGVLVRHEGLTNYAWWCASTPLLACGTGTLVHSSLAFDLALTGVYPPLLVGKSVALLPEEAGPAGLAEALRNMRDLSFVKLTPSHLKLLLEDLPPADLAGRVHAFVVGGEPLTGDDVRPLLEGAPDVRILNHYGPTEAVIGCCTRWVAAEDAHAPVIPIGRPIHNTQLHVLDAHMQPVPPGVAGELYVGGAGVARGYHQRADLTAERFVPDPFATRAGARLYRTGDRARRRADGEIEFLGRLDHQVKIRGHRVEPGEVEAALREQPHVRDALVLARQDEGGAHLVAYVVHDGAPPAPDALADALALRLPPPMVPSAFVMLDALPLTANGKVDRKALPEPGAKVRAVARSRAPRTATEEVVAAIWERLLGARGVGAADDFFALGGHSLLATRVVNRIQAACGVKVTLKDFFSRPTVEALAALVDARVASHVPTPAIKASLARYAPLSYSQRRLWFLHKWDPANTAYHVPWAVRLRGALDVDALRRALATIVRRHAILRTTYEEVDGEPRQRIHEDVALALPLLDVPDEAAAVDACAREARRPFDLATGPVFRAQVLRISPEDHILLVVVHHVAFDGWSAGIFGRELAALYRGEALAPLAVQYADFAAWQRGWMTDEAVAADVEHVRRRLDGVPALDLPTDRARPAVQSGRGQRHRFELPADVSRALRDFARDQDATPFISLFAAFQALLHRLGGQSDFAVAFPVAGRVREETEPLLGFFVNTLLARADVSRAPSYRELVRRVRAEVLQAYAHQDVPFEKVVEALQPERDPSRSPLAQALFTMQDAHARALDLPGLGAEAFPFENPTSKFDLLLVVADADERFLGSFEYDADLFDAATAARFAQRFCALVSGMLRAPDAPIAGIDLLAPEERALLLGPWSGATVPYPRDASVADLFRAQARARPDAVALRDATATTTYAELDARSDRIAGWLAHHGVRPGDRVGVLVERSPGLVATLLGVLKAGAAYVPLDPAHPPERTRFILDDTAPRLVVADAAAAFDGFPVVPLASMVDAAPPRDAPASVPGGDAAAYVMYTSGSTGQPKGVSVPQRGIVRLVLGADHFDPTPEDVYLLHSPATFDASTLEIWAPLLTGGSLAIAPPGHASLAEIAQLLSTQRVTTLWLTAPLFHLMVDEDVEALRGVRRLYSGGDALSPRHVAKALAALPGTRIVNGYGPTENTTFTTCHPLAPRDAERVSIPIGRPIANTRVYVLDEERRLAPVGVRGELYAGGDGLAHGYLRRDELTAERFVPDPFTPGARLYRTGDVVRWLPEGILEFHGRTDHQVKVRGFRVELGEVEAALHADDAVRLAAVVAHAGPTGEKRLVAYASPKPGRTLDRERLRARVADRLPEHMVPSLFVLLDDLPINANGKVDRRALPTPEATVAPASRAPATPTERWLADMWTELLGVERVGAEDGFFDLGGHSLLATRLASRVKHATGVDLPLRVIFQHPTLEALARELDAAGAVPTAEPARIPRHEGPARLSHAQRRLWFLQQYAPESYAYNVMEALRIQGALDVPALERAFVDLVERHHALRSLFPLEDGEAYQVVQPVPERVLGLVDLRDEPDPFARARAISDAEARTPFDLQREVLRARLLRLGPDDHVLILSLHHIVTDGWSMGIILRDLGVLYEARRLGHAPALPALSIQYGDYAEWQRARLDGEGMKHLVDHWTTTLQGLTPLDLPTDRPRPPVRSEEGAFLRFTLPPETMGGLARICREEGASTFMPLLAAYQALLHRYTGQEDFGVGSPSAGRTAREVEDMVGFFVNLLVLRADLKGNPTFRELVRRARDTCLDAYAHQELPFEKIVDVLQPARDTSRPPVVLATLAFQSAPSEGIRMEGLELTRLEREGLGAKQDLTLFLHERNGELAGALAYSTALFDASTVQRMVGHFSRLLAEAVARPDVPMATLPILTEAEARETLRAWNETDAPVTHRLVHETIAEQAARTPDAVAVACGEDALSFAELDRRANRVARRLQEMGLGRDQLVVLCGERSIDLLAGMLGTMKAGAAYVPIDLSTPRERVRYVIEETGSTVGLAVGAAAEALLDGCLVLRLDGDDMRETEDEDAAAPPCPATGDDLAYVIYTSGSTGKPKGVMVRHAGLANYVAWCVSTPLLDGGNGTLVHSSLAFDLALTGLYPALAAGKRVRLVPEDGPTALADALRKETDLSFVKLTPSHLKLLSHELAPHEMAGRVRAFVTGGEALTPDHVKAWMDADPNLRVLNHYGPTETVIGCCTTWVRPEDLDRVTVPIGRPIHNTRVYVLDARMQPVPVGVPGELFVAGAGVARGYLNRQDLTEERFLPDPFAGSGRMYRTGDLVRWLQDGRIEFLGRLDHQVKVRGYRVELGEVESVLREHPEVEDAVVVARESSGHKRLVAYVAAARADPDAMRRFVAERLPEYMVPSVVVPLDRLPLNANGKVDRKALPEPGQARRDAPAEYVAPRDAVEETLARTWAEVLRLDRVGVEDNYFDLGGDSIMSIQIIVRCAQRGVRFTPKQLFQHQTIAELARVAGGHATVEAEQGIVTGDLPLTPIFHHFFARELDEPHHFNMSFLMEAPVDADAQALRAALTALLQHHDALRTSFRREADGWRASVAPLEDVPFEELDYGSLPPEEQDEAFMRDSHRLQATFDLARGPLARMALYRFGARRTPRLLFAVHHLVVDAVSWRILFEDLETAYAMAKRKEAIRLPAKTTSFQRWAQRLQEHAASPEILSELDYWLAEQAPSDGRLPMDDPTGRNTLASGGRVEILLSEEETRQLLQDVPRAYRTQINDVLLTALLQTYHRWTGRSALTVELEGHGREEVVGGVDISRTVGWFTVLFPARLQLADPTDAVRSLREVRDKLRAIPHRGLGYALLRHMAADEVRSRLAALPRPEVRFNYLGVFDPDARAAGTFKVNADSRAADQSRRGMRTQLLDLTGAVTRGRLRLSMTYSQEIHRTQTIEKLAEIYAESLRALIRHCTDPAPAARAPSDFPLANLEKRDLDKVLRNLVKR